MILLVSVVLSSAFPLLAISDNLKLLSTSLRTLEKSACEELDLSCPEGTSISLLSAKYTEGVVCPGASTTCQLPSSLQYSLLQTAVEKCQKKKFCKLEPPIQGFNTDPCPGLPKHLHVHYTCRPYEFRSKTACENELVQLQCGPNSRLAIYSASYGRTQYESIQCPQPQGVPEETCMASYTTETVIKLCHGKRRCALTADTVTFGSPCKRESKIYLKVVYTCVPRQVLSVKYQVRPEEDEALEQNNDWTYHEEGFAAPNTIAHNESANLFIGDILPTYEPDDGEVSGNVHQMTLYLALSAGGLLACLLTVVAARVSCTHRQQLPPIDPQPTVTELPDQVTEVVRFTEEVPRSLATSDPLQFFG
ncbi:unnamed protein product [Nezara viridula]|uniref:SUEL-type lectin domain-containing protein n=1 Tax=Nezara viridula TaxID=85310 RepID=A0A9P0HIY5_NEZVI|nr:unnamed protein product [Nezara viridula]